MVETRRRVTAEDVLEIHARTGARYEVVREELKEMAPTGTLHGGIEAEVAFIIRRYLSDQPVGRVVSGEVLFRLQRDPDTARAADVAFIKRERLVDGRLPTGPFDGPPDLAVEIVSPVDSAADVQEKIADWLEGGTSVIWVLYSTTRGGVVWRPAGATPELRDDAIVEAEPALPGFRCHAADFFAE